MEVKILTLAEEELENAIGGDGDKFEGYGKGFFEAYQEAIEHIIAQPEFWPKKGWYCRHFIIPKYSHSVIYFVEEETIVVVAVMNHKRKPDYWADRL